MNTSGQRTTTPRMPLMRVVSVDNVDYLMVENEYQGDALRYGKVKVLAHNEEGQVVSEHTLPRDWFYNKNEQRAVKTGGHVYAMVGGLVNMS